MKSHAFCFALVSVTAIITIAPAHAQNGTLTRSFVSSSGVDTNPCTVTQPCASFAHAYTMIAANGIVAALDPGKYGPLTIIGPVTINGNGWAAITGSAGNAGAGITINAGSGNVVLTGLEIDGALASANGIVFNNGGSLRIENSVIKDFTGTGIYFVPAVQSSLFVTNTSVIDNSGDGLSVFPTSAGVQISVVLNRVEVLNNGNNGIGMNAARGANTINATATDSTAAGNGGTGFGSTSGANGYAALSLFHCVTSNNGTGIEANGVLAIIVLAQTLVGAGNGNVWQIANSGTINSFGDNYSYFGNAGGIQPFSKF
jgi:hypothetical protein